MLLKKRELIPGTLIEVTGSKSESNRLIVLQSLRGNLEIKNLSNSQDTQLLKKALRGDIGVIDVHHAGTAMRFLTSFFAIQEGKEVLLTGSERMKQRPIKPLVEALRHLGADIRYIDKEGFPPLKISGKKLVGKTVKIPATISSQFVTSLLLISGYLPDGLEVELEGKITSHPYLEMTLALLKRVGIDFLFMENKINVNPYRVKEKENKKIYVESDWSSASYYYALAAIGRKNIRLKTFRKKSLQGDSILQKIYYDFFGVETMFNEDTSITLKPKNFIFPENLLLNMNDCPDIVQTVCITASALKIHFHITGLSTLKVKETDRLEALYRELKKIGVFTEITEDSIFSLSFCEELSLAEIETYNDHRMAMCFAPWSLLNDIVIKNPQVVEKSYPDFWKDFNKITKEL